MIITTTTTIEEQLFDEILNVRIGARGGEIEIFIGHGIT